MDGSRALYRSSSGDRWFLVHDDGRVFVKHMPNPSSGGRPSEIEVEDFLSQGRGPEQQELLRLIGTLAEVPPDAKGPEGTEGSR